MLFRKTIFTPVSPSSHRPFPLFTSHCSEASLQGHDLVLFPQVQIYLSQIPKAITNSTNTNGNRENAEWIFTGLCFMMVS